MATKWDIQFVYSGISEGANLAWSMREALYHAGDDASLILIKTGTNLTLNKKTRMQRSVIRKERKETSRELLNQVRLYWDLWQFLKDCTIETPVLLLRKTFGDHFGNFEVSQDLLTTAGNFANVSRQIFPLRKAVSSELLLYWEEIPTAFVKKSSAARSLRLQQQLNKFNYARLF